MTVQELIDLLEHHDPDSIAMAYDPDTGEHLPITGILWNSTEISFQTDEL